MVSFRAVLDVFVRDIKRIFTNPIATIVFLGILVLPSLYAWYNIAASWDPYGHTGDVQVAVVNNDKGVDTELIGSLNVGSALQKNLESNKSIGWNFVDENTAMEGVNEGKYYAAIVIPANFSESFANIISSSEGEEKKTPQIDYYVNEKINSVAVKVTDTAANTLESQINKTFSSAVSKVISEIVLNLSQTVKGVNDETRTSVLDTLSNAQTSLESLRTTISLTDSSITATKASLLSTQDALSSLQLSLDDVSAALDQSQASVTTIKANVDELYEILKDSGSVLLLEILSTVSTDLASISGLIERTHGTIAGLGPVISSTQTLLDSLYNSADQLSSTNTSMNDVITRLQTSLDTISSGISELSSSSESGLLGVLLGIDSSSVSEFLKNPITLTTERLYPVDNYGSAVAPFYSNLAFWVGGFVLVSIMHVEVSRKGLKRKRLSPTEAYLGRGLLYSVAGIAQGFICCMGDLLMGVQCVNPVAFVLTGMFLSFVYTNLIYMLAATFKHVGKAFAMILIIMQIPGSSGMYPIEMMPHAFQIIHPLLPFTYGIAAVRETLMGFYGANYFLYLLVMLVFLAIALLVGLFLRPKMANLVLLFDRQLRKTDFMVCEESGHFENKDQSFKRLVKSLLRSETYRKEAMRQVKDFEENYERRKKRGLLGMAIGPLAFLVFVAVLSQFITIGIDFKILLMFVWIIALAIAVFYLVSLEYSHQRYSTEARYIDWDEDLDDGDKGDDGFTLADEPGEDDGASRKEAESAEDAGVTPQEAEPEATFTEVHTPAKGYHWHKKDKGTFKRGAHNKDMVTDKIPATAAQEGGL